MIIQKNKSNNNQYVMKDGLKELGFCEFFFLFFTFCAIERIFIEQWHKYVLGWCIFTIGDLNKVVNTYDTIQFDQGF